MDKIKTNSCVVVNLPSESSNGVVFILDCDCGGVLNESTSSSHALGHVYAASLRFTLVTVVVLVPLVDVAETPGDTVSKNCFG